ncbi:type II toxin-antitoxin system prevent-host-death family antitoxin [Bacterioplanoides sp.]|uniref:type II toxin-antitoxin system prevent-host-death family antitoxin n=1 Tax=Bacterioplanoides sp. TaxID=2066072 RepID=UPI003B59EDD4
MINLIIQVARMTTYTATDAKREFGEVLLKSQSEPVSITRNNKPVAVVVSEKDYQELKRQALQAALIEGEQSGDAGVLDMEAIKQKARRKAELVIDAQDS